MEDKRTLYMALKKHGVSDLEVINTYLPHRSIVEIRYMMDKYKKIAKMHMATGKQKRSQERKWTEVIQTVHAKSNFPEKNLVSRALKYIALFEKKKESDIDLSACYLYLSDLCRGETPQELPERDAYFINKCLLKMTENMKEAPLLQSDFGNMNRFLQDLRDLDGFCQSKNTSVINPLGVPKSLLKTRKFNLDELYTRDSKEGIFFREYPTEPPHGKS